MPIRAGPVIGKRPRQPQLSSALDEALCGLSFKLMTRAAAAGHFHGQFQVKNTLEAIAAPLRAFRRLEDPSSRSLGAVWMAGTACV
jgi:hypothetical protein